MPLGVDFEERTGGDIYIKARQNEEGEEGRRAGVKPEN